MLLHGLSLYAPSAVTHWQLSRRLRSPAASTATCLDEFARVHMLWRTHGCTGQRPLPKPQPLRLLLQPRGRHGRFRRVPPGQCPVGSYPEPPRRCAGKCEHSRRGPAGMGRAGGSQKTERLKGDLAFAGRGRGIILLLNPTGPDLDCIPQPDQSACPRSLVRTVLNRLAS